MARHQPTDEQRRAVTVMTGLGAPPKIMADGLGIAIETLERVYAKEIENGPASVKLELAKQLFRAAQTDDGAGRVSAAVKLLDLLAGDEQAQAHGNLIRIRPPAGDGSDRRFIWVDPLGQWMHGEELFDRQGHRISFIRMMPGDENL